jgi:hypothetical protein
MLTVLGGLAEFVSSGFLPILTPARLALSRPSVVLALINSLSYLPTPLRGETPYKSVNGSMLDRATRKQTQSRDCGRRFGT